MFDKLKKNKVINNAIWIIIGKVAQSLLALVIGMLTARYMGPSNYGLISYAASLVAFVVPIMNLGLSNVLVQEYTNHKEEEGEIFGSAIIISIISSVFCIFSLLLFTIYFDTNQPETHLIVFLYSIMLIFQACELVEYWFQAKFLSKYVAVSSFLAYGIVSIYKIFLLLTSAEVFWFAVSNSIDYFLMTIFLVLTYKKMGGRRFNFSFKVSKRMLSNSKHYVISSLMITIFAQTDRIMLKGMVGEEAVGFYTAAVTCASISQFVFGALIDSMRPSIFIYKRDNDVLNYEESIKCLYCIIIYLALIQSITMTCLAQYILAFLYGAEYNSAVDILKISVWYTTFSYMGTVRNIWILAEGKQMYLWIVNLGGALVNVILNWVLIPCYGACGAAIASVITQFFANILINYLVWPLRYNNTLIVESLNPIRLFNIKVENKHTKQ